MNIRIFWFLIFLISFCLRPKAQTEDVSNQYLDSLLNKANQYAQAGKRDSSMQLLMLVIRSAEANQILQYLGPAYLQMGYSHHFQEDNKKAIEYLRKAIIVAESEKDSFVLSRANLMSGIIEFLEGRKEVAIKLIQESIDISKARSDLSYAALALSKIGNIHESEGDFSSATPYFKGLMEVATQTQQPNILLTAHINLAGNAYNLGRFDEALASTDHALRMAKELEKNFEYQEMLNLSALILEKMDRPRDAIKILREYIQHKDSTFNIERNRQIAELELQYETEKKENLIYHQEMELKQGRFRMLALTIGLLIAIMVGLLLYRLTRQLHKSNREKEFLIKEIHHRVKNNLQVLSSLLYLQSQHIRDEVALDAVREGQNRVEAMSLIHQKLYMGNNLAAVDMKDYLYNLGDTLIDAFGLEGKGISVVYHLDPLHLDVDTAIPLGLIVNELVTNSLKYAFPEGRNGTISISLWKNASDRLCLKVTDNGVGQTNAQLLRNSTSFGSNLVEILSKKLKGKIEVSIENGYQTLIEMEKFKLA